MYGNAERERACSVSDEEKVQMIENKEWKGCKCEGPLSMHGVGKNVRGL